MRDNNAPDVALARLASRQHGLVASWQLIALGFSRDAIARRVRAGRLHRVRRGVYAVGHRALSPDGHLMAAVLACGPGAVLSHQSAARVWRIRPAGGARAHVTIPTRTRRDPVGIVVHRPRALPDAETTTRRGLPVTTVARTLLDLAGVLDEPALARAVRRAETERLFDLRAVEAVIARHPNRAHRRLRAAIDLHDSALTRSELEELFLEVCRAHGLPRPQMNVPIGHRVVDALFRDHALVVEIDSWKYHGTRGSFEDDRVRDAELLALGLRTVRVTDRQLERAPGVVAGRLARLLTL